MKKRGRIRCLAAAFILSAGVLMQPLTASAAFEYFELQEVMTNVSLSTMMMEPEMLLPGYDQKIANDPTDYNSYLGRGMIRRLTGDGAGAAADLTVVINAMEQDPETTSYTKGMIYKQRAEANFIQLEQKKYLDDAQVWFNALKEAEQEYRKIYALSPMADLTGQMIPKYGDTLADIQQWSGAGCRGSFATSHGVIDGGVGSTKIQISENFLPEEEGEKQETVEATITLSQPIKKAVRRAGISESIFGGVTFSYGMDNSSVDSVLYVVPAGTSVRVNATTQYGEMISSGNTFSYYEGLGYKAYDSGESGITELTIQEGTLYQVKYASMHGYNSPTVVYLTAG